MPLHPASHAPSAQAKHTIIGYVPCIATVSPSYAREKASGQRTEQVKTGQVNPDRPLVGLPWTSSWDVLWGVLEGLKTGKSALVGALVAGLVGPLVGRGSLSPVLCVVQLLQKSEATFSEQISG